MNEFEQYEAQGQLYFEKADIASANQMFNKALLVAKRDKNINPHRIAEVLNNAGFTYRLLGNSDEAKRYFQQALKIYRQICQKPDGDMAITLHNLGEMLLVEGDRKQGFEYLSEELDIWKQLKEEAQIPRVAACLRLLAHVMADEGYYDIARRNYEQALELRRLSLGADHPDTAESLADLGLFCEFIGDKEAARTYLNAALPILRAELGTNHPFNQEVEKTLQRVKAAGFGRFVN